MPKHAALERLRRLDDLSKTSLMILVAAVVYLALLFALRPAFISAGTMDHMTVMGDHMMTFTSTEQSGLNVAALVGGILAATATALVLGQPVAHPRRDDLAIIKKALSADQKLLLSAVEDAGEITQDSLVFRLGWNRSKVSVMVSNLERMNVVQRRREGKTYVVLLAKR